MYLIIGRHNLLLQPCQDCLGKLSAQILSQLPHRNPTGHQLQRCQGSADSGQQDWRAWAGQAGPGPMGSF
jgi:hypothetical protein